jgi:uncharacterized membrane protein YhaH (DUF805 family)
MEPQPGPATPMTPPPQPPQPQQPFEPTPSTQPVMGEIPRTGAMPDEQRGMFIGRLGQRGYLTVFLFVLAFFIIPYTVVLFLGNILPHTANVAIILVDIVGIIILIPIGIGAGIRRWHDLDQPGWLALLSLVPFINFVAAVILLIAPGTKGPNKYGAEDNRPNTLRKALLGK